ncbi:hypothetical protein ABFS83_14G129500 [Erythranthe nasuta]
MRANHMLISWFSHSVSPDLVPNVLFAPTAQHVWEDFRALFSQERMVMLLVHVITSMDFHLGTRDMIQPSNRNTILNTNQGVLNYQAIKFKAKPIPLHILL